MLAGSTDAQYLQHLLRGRLDMPAQQHDLQLAGIQHHAAAHEDPQPGRQAAPQAKAAGRDRLQTEGPAVLQ
jgi:hypothetical protein